MALKKGSKKPASKTTKSATKPTAEKVKKEKSVGAASRRTPDPNEAANLAKVLKMVEKAGPAGVVQASIKSTLETPYAGWYYLEKLEASGKIKLTTHKMRVYGYLPTVKFVPPAEDAPKPKVKKETKEKAAKKTNGSNGAMVPAGNAAKAAAKKPSSKVKAATKSPAEKAADDLL